MRVLASLHHKNTVNIHILKPVTHQHEEPKRRKKNVECIFCGINWKEKKKPQTQRHSNIPKFRFYRLLECGTTEISTLKMLRDLFLARAKAKYVCVLKK